MKSASFFLLLLLPALGCQRASSSGSAQPSSKPRPGMVAAPVEGADVPQAKALVTTLKTIHLSDPPTQHEADIVENIAESFLSHWDRQSPACTYLKEEGIPRLLPHFDRLLPLADDPAIGMKFDKLLAVFSFYHTPETLERIVHATRHHLPFTQWGDHFWEFQPGTSNYEAFWATMLQTPHKHEADFQDLLSVANNHALNDEIPDHRHPFDSAEGIQLLRESLTSSAKIKDGYILNSWKVDDDSPSIELARLAAEALAFIESPQRLQLLQLAVDHPIETVQMEAAWAQAKLGQQAGLDELVRRTHELPQSLTAQQYLENLGRADLIPRECFKDKFQIKAFCAKELASTFFKPGKIESIEFLDRRYLLWPLERTEVVLIKYRIQFHDGDHSWVVEDIGHVSNSKFHPSSKAIPIFSEKSPGDQLVGYPLDDIYGYLVMTQLKRTFVVMAKAVTEDYAEGDAALEGPEQLPSGKGKLIGRNGVDLQMFQFPQIEAAIFETTQDDQPGWTVLENGNTTFYAQADLPETATAKHVLQMHTGQSYLKQVEQK